MEVPLVYLRDAVVFPYSIAPILAATKFCVAAADEAGKGNKTIFISLLKKVPVDGANDIDVHEVGTLARIVQAVKLADGTTRLLVEGLKRASMRRTIFRKEYLGALVDEIEEDDGRADRKSVV